MFKVFYGCTVNALQFPLWSRCYARQQCESYVPDGFTSRYCYLQVLHLLEFACDSKPSKSSRGVSGYFSTMLLWKLSSHSFAAGPTEVISL